MRKKISGLNQSVGRVHLSYQVEKKQILKKRLWIFIFLPVVFSCDYSCYFPYDSSPYNCNKCILAEFSFCITKNFPVGSSFTDLENYLISIGFTNSNDTKKREFHFLWRDKFSLYGVAVFGSYDDKMKILEISDTHRHALNAKKVIINEQNIN